MKVFSDDLKASTPVLFTFVSSYNLQVVCLHVLVSKPIVGLILLDIFTKNGKNEPTTVEHKLTRSVRITGALAESVSRRLENEKSRGYAI